MPAAGDEALEHWLASNRRIQVKGLWIELARERNYFFLGDLVGTRLESVASFEIFKVKLAHRELFFVALLQFPQCVKCDATSRSVRLAQWYTISFTPIQSATRNCHRPQSI